ncbi:hypothetical protein LJB92_03465 [Bacteroidales bacterium OttesenSCG-928-M06]|nr:hypothetical protein [Bacteroidales bacterium OttesenSCG-928-M06]
MNSVYSKFVLSFLVLLVVFLGSCDPQNDKSYNLDFLETTYNVPEHHTFFDVLIKSGNGDYKIEVENTDILIATYCLRAEKEYIRIEPQKKGVTHVKVTDNISGQSKVLTVNVVNGCTILSSCE